MRVFGAFVMLGLAFVLTRWIRRRHERQESGGAAGQLPAASGSRSLSKAENAAEPERLLTTRGMETVAAMTAFLLILVAMFLILRFIVAF